MNEGWRMVWSSIRNSNAFLYVEEQGSARLIRKQETENAL